jgi:hypothetical protein
MTKTSGKRSHLQRGSREVPRRSSEFCCNIFCFLGGGERQRRPHPGAGQYLPVVEDVFGRGCSRDVVHDRANERGKFKVRLPCPKQASILYGVYQVPEQSRSDLR